MSADNSVRVTLGILEDRGYLVHRRDGARHVYRPKQPADKTRRSVLRRVLTTFFGGSTWRAVSTLLDLSVAELSDELRAARSTARRSPQKAGSMSPLELASALRGLAYLIVTGRLLLIAAGIAW